jgi:hypothetical protein
MGAGRRVREGRIVRRKLLRRRAERRPEFSIAQILAWADAHHRRTGDWPRMSAGSIRGAPAGESWRNVDTALRLGLRGLPGGSSLAQLLARERGVRNIRRLPPLTLEQILAWAEAHRRRTGGWPTSDAGAISEAPGESWRGVDQALRGGLRGLSAGSSLARLLAEKRGVRNLQGLPPLTPRQILTWVDAHHRRTGGWPTCESGAIPEAPGETWKGVHAALHLGRRGMAHGSSLARLLAERRGVRNPKDLPRLTVRQVLRWARAHRRRTGQWPTRSSGPVPEASGETWSAIHTALVTGCRGLPAGGTLAGLLAGRRATPAARGRPRLSVARILAWADAHRERTGSWPGARSGPIPEAPGETWRSVEQALRNNWRGLDSGQTLVQLLVARRGLRTRPYAPPLREGKILTWAREHFRRTGHWPHYRSGAVDGVPGETWRDVDSALQQGLRGLAGGTSLARLLAQRLGIRNRAGLPLLRPHQILTWARAHHRRTGAWPTGESGPVEEAPGETWKSVDMALRWGYRGLAGGTTLARLLAQRLGVRNRASLPHLSEPQVRAWAEAHRRRTGAWPTRNSGPIPEAPEETWNAIDQALRAGHRGLPGHSSLFQLLHGGDGAAGKAR